MSPPGKTRSSKVAAISALRMTPPAGTYPEFTPLAKVIRCGTTSCWSRANQDPVRPKPAITSSRISTTPYRSAISRTPAR
nr:hypothetical protein DA06_15240 [Georgenia sp. SUBG003]